MNASWCGTQLNKGTNSDLLLPLALKWNLQWSLYRWTSVWCISYSEWSQTRCFIITEFQLCL